MTGNRERIKARDRAPERRTSGLKRSLCSFFLTNVYDRKLPQISLYGHYRQEENQKINNQLQKQWQRISQRACLPGKERLQINKYKVESKQKTKTKKLGTTRKHISQERKFARLLHRNLCLTSLTVKHKFKLQQNPISPDGRR